MEIVYKKLSEIKPYEKNPRKNDDAVQYVMESIKNFGFKVPIVIDSDGIIVCGHTRFKASKKLRLKEVPCVIADDLNDEQIKAFRLADNKVSEKADWDFDILTDELFDISLDMEQFGFEPVELSVANEPESDDFIDDGYYGDERERTNIAYNLDLSADAETSDDYWEMPMIYKIDHVPSHMIGFNYAKTSDDNEAGIHFYIDDYQFERIWNKPQDYVDVLSRFDSVLTPDFSLYMDMPMPIKIWNVYRSRLIGNFLQSHGLIVIPTISWAEPATFDFCFSGIEPGGTVSVSTIGVKNDEESKKIWVDGMNEMIKRIHPKTILVYGGEVDYNYGDIKVIHYDNEVTKRWQNRG